MDRVTQWQRQLCPKRPRNQGSDPAERSVLTSRQSGNHTDQTEGEYATHRVDLARDKDGRHSRSCLRGSKEYAFLNLAAASRNLNSGLSLLTVDDNECRSVVLYLRQYTPKYHPNDPLEDETEASVRVSSEGE